MAISPVRLNHAVLFVADLERSLDFYTGVFGMDVVAREPRANAAFLRLPRSGNHHDLGLFGVGTAGGPKRPGAIGLYHLAWQLDTIDELAAHLEDIYADARRAGRSETDALHLATQALAESPLTIVPRSRTRAGAPWRARRSPGSSGRPARGVRGIHNWQLTEPPPVCEPVG